MKYIVLFLSVFLFSCSTTPKEEDNMVVIVEKEPYIDPEFQPYVDKFIAVSRGIMDKSDFARSTITMKELKGSTAGTCLAYPTYDGGDVYFSQEIEVDKTYWLSYSDLEKEDLMFHEFGHCYLHRGHTEEPKKKGLVDFFQKILFKIGLFEKKGYLKDGCPDSMMYPYVLGNDCVYNNYEHYIDELFGYIVEVEVVEEVVIEEECYNGL